MPFELKYTPEAQQQYDALSKNKNLAKRFKAVKRALRFLLDDPTHPSLNPHNYDSLEGPGQSDVFEAYVKNKTPGAYRIFWCYYPPKKKAKEETALQRRGTPGTSKAKKEAEQPATITIIAVTPHP